MISFVKIKRNNHIGNVLVTIFLPLMFVLKDFKNVNSLKEYDVERYVYNMKFGFSRNL